MAFLSVGIPLAITWRVSKEFLMGNGDSLFAEMSEKPAYVLDLGVCTAASTTIYVRRSPHHVHVQRSKAGMGAAERPPTIWATLGHQLIVRGPDSDCALGV